MRGATGRTWLLIGLAGLALGVRLVGLSSRDLWADEQATLIDSQGVRGPDPRDGRLFLSTSLRTGRGFVAIERESATHDQPIYVGLIHLWTRALAPTEFSLRLFSALLGAATVPLVALLGLRLVGDRAAWLGALLLVVAPLHVHYSQEARTYACTLFLVVLSNLVALRMADVRSSRAWAGYGALAAAVPALHLLAAITLVPQALWLARRATWRRGLLVALGTGTLLWAALTPLGLLQSIVTAHEQSGLYYQNPPLELRDFARPTSFSTLGSGVGATVTRFLGVEYFPLHLRGRFIFWVALPLLAIAVFSATRLGARRARLFLVGGALLPLALTTALSLGYGHVVPLQDRYSVFALPFLILLVADGISRLRPAPALAATGATVLLFGAFTIVELRADATRQGPRAEEAAALAECGGIVAVEDPLHASVLAAFSRAPIAIALTDPAAGKHPFAWSSEVGLCAQANGVACPLATTPCPAPPARESSIRRP